ncbi:hypothetical protein [Paenibacillus glacialis]|uniref:hypothetical protein n=1 Tax=Paenibacillus glacialis TaxID=494026 RepID=UPI001FE1D810|nr:hypothetical protein [Paenibacillus glacialis]
MILLKGINYLTIAILNFLAAIAFVVTDVISDHSNWKITYGFGFVALLFAITGVANTVNHFKKK